MKYKIDKFPRTERSFEEECLKLIEKIKKNGTSLVVYNEELGVIGIGKVKVDNEYKGVNVRTIHIKETREK